MLILTRRPGEDIIIDMPNGTSVTIRITEVRGDQVRIGLQAPADCDIYRSELSPSISSPPAAGNARPSRDQPAWPGEAAP